MINIQQKAVELFKAGYTKAIQMQVYDEYTAKIRAALGRLASQQFPPEHEARGKQWAENALALDQHFHELISHSSGSERLAEEIGKYRNLVVAVGDAVGNKLHAHDQNLKEHAAIIDHLLFHQADQAALAMGRHIDRGAETAAEWLGMVHGERARTDAASAA